MGVLDSLPEGLLTPLWPSGFLGGAARPGATHSGRPGPLCPLPSVPGSWQIKKSCPGLKKNLY